MPSLLPGFAYDVFISYRQNDNRSGWVRQFVEDLREELAATLKDPVNIYFDENPHDGLHDTHLVDESLKGKLTCVIFMPILSRTYCDPKSFAWNHEFVPFCQMARHDTVGSVVQLSNGNVASRVLPILVHDIGESDRKLFEGVTGNLLRPVEFVFRSPGVNRPLTPEDERSENQSKTIYRDQINKAAIAASAILTSSPAETSTQELPDHPTFAHESPDALTGTRWFIHELRRRNVARAGITYVILSLLLLQILAASTPLLQIEERFMLLVSRVLAIGLPFALLLAWRFEVSPHGFVRTNSEKSHANPYPSSRKKPLTSPWMVLVLIIAFGLLALYAKIIIGLDEKPSTLNPVPLAVLPIEIDSPDTQEQNLANALTDDIISRLSVLPQLRVTNRRSTQKFQGMFISSYDAVASELNVKMLLMGKLKRVGTQVTIQSQLINASNNRFIWGNTFVRTTRNYMNVQGDIAMAVATHLGIDLSDWEREQLTRLLTNSDSAYYWYTKGRNLYFKYKSAPNDSAIQQFKLAIEADPKYAQAWAALGDAFGQVFNFTSEPRWLDSAIVAGERAVKLDSNLSDGYKAVALAYSYKKLYDKAFPLLKKAVQLSPSNAQAVGNLGTAYMMRAELVDALQFQKRSAGITPANWIAYQLIGWTYGLLDDRERAIESLNKSLELNPYGQTYEVLAYNYVSLGRPRDALALIPALLKLGPDDFKVLERAGLIAHFAGDEELAKGYLQRSIANNKNYKLDVNTSSAIGLGQILLQQGKRVEADVLLTHALEMNQNEMLRGSQDDEMPFRIAAVHAIREQKTEMLYWLSKAIEARWVDCTQVTHGPWFSNYRNDKDLLDLLKPVKDRLNQMRKEAERLSQPAPTR